MYESELYHHGILGMKWGKRNGPPYPLGSGDHSSSEKKAGWRKSLSGGSNDSTNIKVKRSSKNSVDTSKKSSNNEDGDKKSGLTKGQKIALGVGAGLAAAALVGIGAYALHKSRKLDSLADKGKKIVDDLVNRPFDEKLDSLAGKGEKIVDDLVNRPFDEKLKLFYKNKIMTAAEDMEAVNSEAYLTGDLGARMNCVLCSTAYELRRRGYDVTAQLSNRGRSPETAASYFLNANVINKSIKSSALLEQELLSNGEGARGNIIVEWLNLYGGNGGKHSMVWENENGKVLIRDTQNNTIRSLDSFAGLIKANITYFRTDNLEINPDTIKSAVATAGIKNEVRDSITEDPALHKQELKNILDGYRALKKEYPELAKSTNLKYFRDLYYENFDVLI